MSDSNNQVEVQHYRVPGWNYVDFAIALKDATGGNPKLKSSEYQPEGKIPIVDQGSERIAGYTDDESLICRANLPCILFGDHTKAFKFVEQEFVLGADGVKVLQPQEGVFPRFAYYFIRHVGLPDNAGYSRHFKFLKEHRIPAPELEEQKRIAAILDKADAIRRKRQEVSVIARDAVRDFFLRQFGDPISNPNNYDSTAIAEVAKIVTGNTPSRKEPENYGDGIEWIKSDNINTPFHYLTESTERLSQIGEKKSRPVPAGSTLVTCIAGSPDCIGNAALSDRRVASNQQINAAVPGDRLVDKFLYSMILVLKPAIQRLSSKSMKGMVSKGRFETLQVIVPPKPEQERFADIFDRIVGVAKRMDIAANDSEDLFNSLVQRAFKGEL